MVKPKTPATIEKPLTSKEMRAAVERIEAARNRVREAAVSTLVRTVRRRGIALIGPVELRFDQAVRASWPLPKDHRLNRPTDDDAKPFDLVAAALQALVESGMDAKHDRLDSPATYTSLMQVGRIGQMRTERDHKATHCLFNRGEMLADKPKPDKQSTPKQTKSTHKKSELVPHAKGQKPRDSARFGA